MAAANNPLRSMVVSAVLGALAIVLPMVFHAVGLGSHFLPMLLPLLLNAFLASAGWAAFTAMLVPWISAVATGMPPIYPPVALVMCLEALAMALAVSLARRCAQSIIPALFAGILADRLVSFVLMYALSGAFHLPARMIATAVFVHGLPGILLQIAVVPAVLKTLNRKESLLFGYDDERKA